jgi:hypothetical protein
MKHDVVIPYCKKDEYTIYKCIDSISKINNVNNIYVISLDKFVYKDVIWVDEKIFPFTKEDITRINPSIPRDRAGWYFQQLLKMYSFIIPNIMESFLMLDSDVIFLKNVDFYGDGKFKYNYSSEYTPDYFDCMSRLNTFFEKIVNMSGICHHMIFEKSILDEIFKLIKKEGEEVYETIIKAVQQWHHGFSEYELYFNYIFKKYPNRYTIRQLKYADVDDYKSHLSADFDYIANHEWKRK